MSPEPEKKTTQHFGQAPVPSSPGRCSADRRPTKRDLRRRRLIGAIALLLAVMEPALRATEPLRAIYPSSESSTDARPSYPLAVLRLALEHSGREFRLQPNTVEMQQERSLRMLAEGSRLDVLWSVTTSAREARLRPIRFPIDFGLIGWRVLLVRRGDAARFAAVDSVDRLAALVAGQGHDWPDLDVLRDNGLRVTTATTYEGLFAMLARKRIDYFPRAVSEVREELKEHAALPIELEPHLLLHYPSALYFFVNPANDALATALETGLERALGDGSLAAEFERAFAQDLAAVRGRAVLELANRALPAATPRARRELWIDPSVRW